MMRNDLNNNDIKKSIIYHSNNSSIKTALVYGLSIVVFFGLLIFFTYLDWGVRTDIIIPSVILIGVTLILTTYFVLTKYLQNKYLIDNYSDFYSCETELNDYRLSQTINRIHFVVQINYQGTTKTVKTNFCQFSNSNSKYYADHLYQRKVSGLYDDKKDIFYIISFVD